MVTERLSGSNQTNNWGLMPTYLILGIIILLFNAPSFFSFIANNYIPFDVIREQVLFISQVPDMFYAQLPGTPEHLFVEWMRWCLYATGIYFILLILVGFRKGKLHSIFVVPVSGLLGIGFVPMFFRVVELVKFVIEKVIFVAMFVYDWILEHQTLTLTILFSFLIFLLITFLLRTYRFRGALALISIGVLLWMIALYADTVFQIATSILIVISSVLVITMLYQLLRRKLVFIALLSLSAPLLWFMRAYVFAFFSFLLSVIIVISQFILFVIFSISNGIANFFRWIVVTFPILSQIWNFIINAITMFFTYLGGTMIVVGLLASLGYLFLDDVKAAWNSGTGVKGISQGIFAVGLTFSLLLMVSMGSMEVMNLVNSVWISTVPPEIQFNNIMFMFINSIPAFWQPILITNFAGAGTPLFDIFLLSIILLSGLLGGVRGLWSGSTKDDDFSVAFLSPEALLMLIMPAISLLFTIVMPYLSNISFLSLLLNSLSRSSLDSDNT